MSSDLNSARAAVRLDGVRILVTGASSGLGLAMARALLEGGATVALASRPGPRLGAARRAADLRTSCSGSPDPVVRAAMTWDDPSGAR